MATANPCANVEIRYKGDGRQVLFTFPFTYLSQPHIRVSLWDDTKKEYVDVPDTDWSFANATTIQFVTAPPVPPTPTSPSNPEIFNVKIYRITDINSIQSTFYPGSAIRAEDLNDNFDQLRLAIQEQRCELFGSVNLLLEDKVWNKFQIGYTSGKLTGDTITKSDQLTGKWPKDGNDQYIATSDAISSRLDPYVQDTVPNPIGLPNKEQEGKTWFDTGELLQRFWDADAGAWVTLANTGPQGPPGPNVFYGTAFPPEPNDYGLWYDTNRKELRIKYDDGTGVQWVLPLTSASSLNGLIAGNGVSATPINEISIIDQGVI